MRTFKDDLGREWRIKITPPVLKDVRTNFPGVDLGSWEKMPFDMLASNSELLVDVLWFLVTDQAQAMGVTNRQFGEAMLDCIDAATTALIEASNDSFHSSKRSLRRSLLEKTAALQAEGAELLLAKLDDPETRREMLRAALAKAMPTIAGSSPESSAKPPDTSETESASSSPAVMPLRRATG